MNQRAGHITLDPPLKWAGGKRWLVPHLLPLWERYAAQTDSPRLVEPFCGGLAVALGLAPENAILNDINPHLINFYRQLQRGLVAEIDMVNDPDVYYRHRERFNALIRAGKAETPEAAALFYYLNRTGFNGLCRFNKAGEFNVPFGRYTKITYTKDFRSYATTLSKWKFVCGAFSSVEKSQGDFIYADPPYDVEFTEYSAGGFSWEDQVALVEWLKSHDGPVILSNQATERIIDLYSQSGFALWYFNAPRRISSSGDRDPAREVLAIRGFNFSLQLTSEEPKEMTKNASTGHVLEEMVRAALVTGKYEVQKQVNIGLKVSGKKHIIDLIASRQGGDRFLISLKWQQSSGTAEEKIPYEVICLKDAIVKGNGHYRRAYLVLGGTGWTLRDYYIKGDFESHLPHRSLITIIALEDFIAKANEGKL